MHAQPQHQRALSVSILGGKIDLWLGLDAGDSVGFNEKSNS